VALAFFNATSTDASAALEALELEIAPRYAVHNSRIDSNPALFARIEAVRAAAPELSDVQQRLLDETRRRFVRAGAMLDEQDRARVDAINEQLATLTTRFGQNVLHDSNAFELVISAPEETAGLPGFVLDAAAAEAERRGHAGKYAFTLSRSSITPFLQHASNRALREQIYRAYTRLGRDSDDNALLIREIVRLRGERARLLGYATHADYMLEDRMAGTPAAVTELLSAVWEPCREKVAEETADLQAELASDDGEPPLQPWDWWFYTERVRQRRFDLDATVLKPYFELNAVRDGAFEVARRLYGITFHERTDLPRYHPDVTAYEVREADGRFIGIFLFDFFARPSKKSGAWMTVYRSQNSLDGHVSPVIANCCNFPKSDPCLLGPDEVRTLFHELGHGLHGLLSRVRYRSMSGTKVKQDFVELPSQIMEHWAVEPEVLRDYARHHKTGETIPDSLIDKLLAARTFNQGFATAEYLAACFLDMAWHGVDGEGAADVDHFEASVMREMGMPAVIDPRYKSGYFQHIFSGDHYSAGYYVYLWAEVLDADGFDAFLENGLFDADTARRFREQVLERGGSVDPMALYRAFRGRDPEIGPLLRKRGLAGSRAAA
jgi:peptidyl-dipeptidase Dcp